MKNTFNLDITALNQNDCSLDAKFSTLVEDLNNQCIVEVIPSFLYLIHHLKGVESREIKFKKRVEDYKLKYREFSITISVTRYGKNDGNYFYVKAKYKKDALFTTYSTFVDHIPANGPIKETKAKRETYVGTAPNSWETDKVRMFIRLVDNLEDCLTYDEGERNQFKGPSEFKSRELINFLMKCNF